MFWKWYIVLNGLMLYLQFNEILFLNKYATHTSYKKSCMNLLKYWKIMFYTNISYIIVWAFPFCTIKHFSSQNCCSDFHFNLRRTLPSGRQLLVIQSGAICLCALIFIIRIRPESCYWPCMLACNVQYLHVLQKLTYRGFKGLSVFILVNKYRNMKCINNNNL